MAFVTVSDDILNKSLTQVENIFITKYMPVLDPVAVKVYLYSVYIFQSGLSSYTPADLARVLSITEEQLQSYFDYLEEFELVSVTDRSPLEIKIMGAENLTGTPKKFKPEKYSDFTKSVQNLLKGRMISTNEFREYFILLEEYGFDQNALLMIINYCVDLKGDDIRFAYIKKVAKSFADEGVTTAKKVDDKLSAYTSATPALIKIFSAAGIKKHPDIDDEKMYKKWTGEFGFDDNAVIVAAKCFKAKSSEKLDDALGELYKNKKFDIKEIEDYCNNKNSVLKLTSDIAKNLGVYIQTNAPYAENYTNIWCNFGYSFDCLKLISVYCFRQGIHSFQDMDAFIRDLYDEGVVADKSVNDYISARNADDNLLKGILKACGLTRKIIPWDRECLEKWRVWKFSDDMLYAAAKLSSGKSNPIAYMNGILSSWKNEGIMKIENLPSSSRPEKTDGNDGATRAEIEMHFYNLRHAAEEKAERALGLAVADGEYGSIKSELSELSIQLAFAEIHDTKKAEDLSSKIKYLNEKGDRRLKELGINKADFIPDYSCKKCNDTGYKADGTPCDCMKKFIATLK